MIVNGIGPLHLYLTLVVEACEMGPITQYIVPESELLKPVVFKVYDF